MKKLPVLPIERTKQYWSSLHGVGQMLMFANFYISHDVPCLLILPNAQLAYSYQEALKFFLPLELKQDIFILPDWETLPYDRFSPHEDLISERLIALNRLKMGGKFCLIASIDTLMHKFCPVEFLTQHAMQLALGQKINLEEFRGQLINAGYQAVEQVYNHGSFAIRGGIMDLYPMGAIEPLRIEFFDDEVETLRLFDPDTQRTTHETNIINLLPGREFPIDEVSISRFRSQFREKFTGNATKCSLYEAISSRTLPAGIEYYLPLFFDKTATIFDYLPNNVNLFLVDELLQPAESFWQEVQYRHSELRYDLERPILEPGELFIEPNIWFGYANKLQQVYLLQETLPNKSKALDAGIIAASEFLIAKKSLKPLESLVNFIQTSDYRVALVVESAGRREVLQGLLKSSEMTATLFDNWQEFLESDVKFGVLLGVLYDGMQWPSQKLAILTERQWYGSAAVIGTKDINNKVIDPDVIIRDLAELKIGAPVVHMQFGVGRYQGLQTLEIDNIPNEFLVLLYANNDKIYVPVTSLNAISRYTGADWDKAPLHQLGSDLWQKQKQKASEKVQDLAVELLDLYARREAAPGVKIQLDDNMYQRFVQGFPFTETQDQLRATNEIIHDLAATKPMDRLICGDVGFGKTEVAMRAAFIVASAGKQVCVLVPTTLLASQHYETFCDRFADFPINIGLLSRFRTASEAEDVITKLASGQLDIVIGTHKLFASSLKFKNLGLLIIDEEHRFGVKQKEIIKHMRSNVDLLSMTATPIPRTLNMALSGIRDISLIATPPAKRLAIKTFWQHKSKVLVREAILREIFRGGQVYYVHNDINTIARVTEELNNWVPEAKIIFAHGQMRELQLERIMADFHQQRFQVLVCTTIIETGIDVPTANTIIIERADKFGLAQLHQLRGRVGRSHHQAYAYLLTPDVKSLTKDAIKRLEAIVSLEDLGAGYTLATHDLEIRGAGELLGDQQSGNMHAVGFNLFMEMLNDAVESLKNGKDIDLNKPLKSGVELQFNFSTIIPENYIADVHQRLIIYKRIANSKNTDQLSDLIAELVDRFGTMPESVKLLLRATELKQIITSMGIKKIQGSLNGISIEFSDQVNINSINLINCLQRESNVFKMQGPQILKINHSFENPNELFTWLQRWLVNVLQI